MEGVTGYLYRRVHMKYFPGADVYYTPFLSVNQLGITDTEHEVVPVLGRAGMWPAGNYPA